MNILLGICLLLVMVSLIMALNSMTRLERLKHQNELMQKELLLLKQEYLQLQERMILSQGSPRSATASSPRPAEAEAEDPKSILQEQMQLLQAVLEAYRQQHEGRFPRDLISLARFADRQDLQKMVENPYTHTRNPLVSEDVCLDITHDPADEGLPEYAGRLLFQAHLGPQDQALGYTLAAFDEKGMLLKDTRNEVLTYTYSS